MSSRYPQIVPEPNFYKRPIAEMFDGLDAFEQRALIDRLALSSAQVDQLVTDGLIAHETVLGMRGQPVNR